MERGRGGEVPNLQADLRQSTAEGVLREARIGKGGLPDRRLSCRRGAFPAGLETGDGAAGVLGALDGIEVRRSDATGAGELERSGQQLELRPTGYLDADRLQRNPAHRDALLDRLVG